METAAPPVQKEGRSALIITNFKPFAYQSILVGYRDIWAKPAFTSLFW